MFYRHFLQDNTDFNPFQGAGPAGYLGFPVEGHSRTQHATFAVNTSLSSSLLNELRVGRASNDNVSLNLPLLNPKDFGINYDRNQETAGGLGLPDVTINGMSGIGNQIQGPTTNPAQEWQISNVLSKSAGRHLLKMGGEFRRGVDDFDLGFFFVGRFVFNGTYTGDSFADFLLGRAVEFNHAKGRTKLAMRNQNLGAFFQDDIKVRDNFTLNLGVRYDFYSPITDALGQTSTFVVRQPDNGTAQSGVAEVIIAGTNGLPENSTYFPDKNNVQPRVGFAWDIFGDGRLALRGGGGVFHNQLRNNLALQHILSYPFQEQPVYRDTTLENPIKPVEGNPIIGQLYSTDPDIVTPYTVAYSVGMQWQFARSMVAEVAYVQNDGKDLLQFRGNESAVLRRRPDDRAQQGSLPAVSRLQLRAAIDQLGPLRLQGARDERPAPVRERPGVRRVLHAGDLARPVVGVPFRRDQHHLSAEAAGQQQPRSRIGELRLRRAAPVHRLGDLGAAVRRRPPLAEGRRAVTRAWRMDGGEPVDVPERIPVQRVRRRRSLPARGRLHGVVPSESRRRSRHRRADGGTMVQHQRVRPHRAGPVRQRAAQLVPRPRPGEHRRVADQADLSGRVRRGMNLEVRIEVFNLFNRVNFGVPNLNIASGAFGRIGSTATEAREMQFGLKFTF